MASTPETSDHTIIKERITLSFDLTKALRKQITLESLLKLDLPLQPLSKFEDSVNYSEKTGILFSFDGELTLVDFTGRCVRQDKRGATPAQLPPILQRLNIDRLTTPPALRKTTKRDSLGEHYTLKEHLEHR